MAIGRVKTWIAEILTFADLNAEFDNIINNGQDLVFPATKSVDLNGFELILDSDGDTSITADTDDRIDFRASGADLFRMDGTVTTPINGVNFVASATGVAVHMIAMGADTNINLEIRSKGSGDVVLTDDSGNEIIVAADVASAVNEITVTNAVTTAAPFIQATGDDTNINLELRSKGSGDVVLADDSGNEILIAADVASAVNEFTITNAATGNAPIIQSSGEANIGFQLHDSNSNEVVLAAATASAVNELTITNAATGNAPSIAPTGDDTNIGLGVTLKGTGVMAVAGTGGMDVAGPVKRNGLVLAEEIIDSGTVSAAASLDITDLPAGYRSFRIEFDDLVPGTDNRAFYLRTSSDNGVSFDAGASDYQYSIFGNNQGNPTGTGGALTGIQLNAVVNLGTGAGETAAGRITIHNPRDATSRTRIEGTINFRGQTTSACMSVFGGERNAAEDNDAIQLIFFADGTIATMNWTLIGVRAS